MEVAAEVSAKGNLSEASGREWTGGDMLPLDGGHIGLFKAHCYWLLGS